MTKRTHGRTASGRPITDDLVDDLAGKATKGFDVERTLERRAGRPLMGAGPAAVESVRLDPDLREALHTRARRDHESASAVIRRALRGYLEEGS